MPCPVCHEVSQNFGERDGYSFFECSACETISLDPAVINEIDQGRSLVDYTAVYWEQELAAARTRSFGPALARVAECFLYCRRTIDVFLDVGSGPGYLLESLSRYLPTSAHKFYGVEKFPPHGFTVDHPNYVVGELSSFSKKVDAGCCIEMIEHLTPKMLSKLFEDLASISNPDALFIFNSGQPSFVKFEDPSYLDPTGRGHIMSYSAKSLSLLAGPAGWRVHALPGKTWALLIEKTNSRVPEDITGRIWSPVKENLTTLHDPHMGSLMYILGIDTARAYS